MRELQKNLQFSVEHHGSAENEQHHKASELFSRNHNIRSYLVTTTDNQS